MSNITNESLERNRANIVSKLITHDIAVADRGCLSDRPVAIHKWRLSQGNCLTLEVIDPTLESTVMEILKGIGFQLIRDKQKPGFFEIAV